MTRCLEIWVIIEGTSVKYTFDFTHHDHKKNILSFYGTSLKHSCMHIHRYMLLYKESVPVVKERMFVFIFKPRWRFEFIMQGVLSSAPMYTMFNKFGCFCLINTSKKFR